eukprot:COSAG02_NODE_6860_length_3322_cov_2.729755_3_plen_139_part_00
MWWGGGGGVGGGEGVGAAARRWRGGGRRSGGARGGGGALAAGARVQSSGAAHGVRRPIAPMCSLSSARRRTLTNVRCVCEWVRASGGRRLTLGWSRLGAATRRSRPRLLAYPTLRRYVHVAVHVKLASAAALTRVRRA